MIQRSKHVEGRPIQAFCERLAIVARSDCFVEPAAPRVQYTRTRKSSALPVLHENEHACSAWYGLYRNFPHAQPRLRTVYWAHHEFTYDSSIDGQDTMKEPEFPQINGIC